MMQDYLNDPLFTIAGTPITLGTLITLVAIFVATLIVARILERATVRAFKLRKVEDEGTIGVARRLVHYLVLLTGLGIGLDTIGIDLGALFAAGALFAVALGFAMQNIAQNFVSGVILLLERSIKPGDILLVEGRLVKVSRMGIRATVSRTLDDEEIIIPNSILVQNSVTNYTLWDRLYRLRTIVGVTYGSDMALVRKVLEKTTTELKWRVSNMEPRILLKAFGSSSVDFDVSVWIEDPWRVNTRLSQLNEAIWWAFKEAGITIAFPQLDVHLDSEVVQPLRELAGPSAPAASGS